MLKRHFARANMNMHLCDSHPELVLIFLGEQHLKTSTTIKYSMPAEVFRLYSITSSANTSPSINHPCKLKSVWVLGTSRYSLNRISTAPGTALLQNLSSNVQRQVLRVHHTADKGQPAGHQVLAPTGHKNLAKKNICRSAECWKQCCTVGKPALAQTGTSSNSNISLDSFKGSGPLSDPILELVVDKNTLHIEPHGTAFRREHVAGELERHGGGDEGQSSELDLTWHIPVGGGCYQY